MRKPVVIETPYNSKHYTREQCVRYALWCCYHATLLGESPFASHLFFTQFLPEDKESREIGLACRDTWARSSQARIVRYTDLGETSGMFREIDGTAIRESRKLPDVLLDKWRNREYPTGSLKLCVSA